jgi:hypothetical protein
MYNEWCEGSKPLSLHMNARKGETASLQGIGLDVTFCHARNAYRTFTVPDKYDMAINGVTRVCHLYASVCPPLHTSQTLLPSAFPDLIDQSLTENPGVE